MLFGWKENKFKVLGITVLRYKTVDDVIQYKLFGLPFLKLKMVDDTLVYRWFDIYTYKNKNSIFSVQFRVNQNKNFDISSFDKELEKYAPSVKNSKQKSDSHKIAYLVTELYDYGGHSKCVLDQVKILKDNYKQACFIGQIHRTKFLALKNFEILKKYCDIFGYNLKLYCYKNTIIKLFNDIIKFSPSVLFVWIHPNDCLMAVLLGMLKKHTNIKILYCPHASHYPNLGITYADAVLEALPTAAYITQKFRKNNKTIFVPMISKKIEDFPSFTVEEIADKRKKIGVKENDLCTMSGAAAYKFFDGNASEYFQTIKKLLEHNRNVKHVILSDFSKAQQKIIDDIFSESEAKSRLIILPFSDKYELFFKCADVFIDSFPVSSALTMIDLMRLKVPYAVKINRENAHFSFHEYQASDYPYMFEKADDLLKGVETLLADKSECNRVTAMNYQYYLKTFGGNAVKKRLCEVIDNPDHLERFYTGPINETYQFKELGL